MNNQLVICPWSFESQSKCKVVMPEPVSKPKVAELYKMEHCITYAEMHKEKYLAGIYTTLIKDCRSKNPNSFWKHEKYFVSLPFDPLQKID